MVVNDGKRALISRVPSGYCQNNVSISRLKLLLLHIALVITTFSNTKVGGIISIVGGTKTVREHNY